MDLPDAEVRVLLADAGDSSLRYLLPFDQVSDLTLDSQGFCVLLYSLALRSSGAWERFSWVPRTTHIFSPVCAENTVYAAPLTIFRTYKFMRTFNPAKESTVYYDQKRRPAWTDRILHWEPKQRRISPVSYQSHPEITLSDHVPVSADFRVQVGFLSSKLDRANVQSITRYIQ